MSFVFRPVFDVLVVPYSRTFFHLLDEPFRVVLELDGVAAAHFEELFDDLVGFERLPARGPNACVNTGGGRRATDALLNKRGAVSKWPLGTTRLARLKQDCQDMLMQHEQ